MAALTYMQEVAAKAAASAYVEEAGTGAVDADLLDDIMVEYAMESEAIESGMTPTDEFVTAMDDELRKLGVELP